MILRYVHVFIRRILFLQFLFQRNIICSWLKTKGIMLNTGLGFWNVKLVNAMFNSWLRLSILFLNFLSFSFFFSIYLGLFSHLRSDLIAISIHIFRKSKSALVSSKIRPVWLFLTLQLNIVLWDA
jgi:hypothetical protein